MTEAQLEVARKHVEYHQKQFGLTKPNVHFVKGFMEHMSDVAELKESSFDVIVYDLQSAKTENKSVRLTVLGVVQLELRVEPFSG
jgi:hypothetical protein